EDDKSCSRRTNGENECRRVADTDRKANSCGRSACGWSDRVALVMADQPAGHRTLFCSASAADGVEHRTRGQAARGTAGRSVSKIAIARCPWRLACLGG